MRKKNAVDTTLRDFLLASKFRVATHFLQHTKRKNRRDAQPEKNTSSLSLESSTSEDVHERINKNIPQTSRGEKSRNKSSEENLKWICWTTSELCIEREALRDHSGKRFANREQNKFRLMFVIQLSTTTQAFDRRFFCLGKLFSDWAVD